ncbi:hypothetical protein [Leeuwenhoekiella marinoflava]|uniref:Uncharacterized protein n=2 Tax=Leeuwenhoekiella marinoflava TaxID=988 RepID=A0A4Q0PEV3_9FLAO|nr:hypothetical protein [Leeuwenhoekiella marinoflava]RXG25460.1 hypothetical protein DSL99_3495 [Leeuwenhoekiella marinoflava]SHF86371.1 hypothetical protein SAMN02745246_03591 [Leeuwenhoekiella marinoflava DSM 3653]
MKGYHKNFKLDIDDTLVIRNKINDYFKTYDFEQLAVGNDTIFFFKKPSFLNSWEDNPLNWEMEIEVHFSKNNKALITHRVNHNNILTSKAFSELFENFLLNLNYFLVDNRDFKDVNTQALKVAKEKLYKYYALIITGILLGYLSGILLANSTEIALFRIIGVVMGGIMTEKLVNSYLSNKVYTIHKT